MSNKKKSTQKKNTPAAKSNAPLENAKSPATKVITVVIAAVLTVAIILIAVLSGNRDPLKGYTEDTATDKDYYYVAMAVEKQGIIVKLDAVNAPKTTENFVKLVREGFYDGLTFHRVINNFMIQGGDPKADGTGGSPNKIIGEFSQNGIYNPIKHERGTISMARSSVSMDSASSQFFICNSTSASVVNLDGSYAAFGHVVEGMDVVDSITADTAKYGNSNGMISDYTKQAVITKMMVIEYEESN